MSDFPQPSGPRRRLAAAVAAGLLGALLTPSYAAAVDDDPHDPQEDLTAPTITIAVPSGGVDGWYDHAIDVHVSAVDRGTPTSGLASVGYVLTGAHTTGSESVPHVGGRTVRIANNGRTTISVEASDAAGNTSSAQATVGVDTAKPTVTYGGRVQAGATFVQGEEVALTYTCTDHESGIAGCDGPVPSGGLLDTSTLGTNRTVSVTATDHVGNKLTHVVTYTVVRPHFDVVTHVSLAGTGRVGSPLTVVPGEFTPTPTSVSYAWLRDGQPMDVTGTTYTPTADDLDHGIKVVATAHRDDLDDLADDSGTIGVVRGELLLDVPAHLEGTARVGSVLELRHGAILPTAPATYRWFRDATPIAGATGRTYRLTPADDGHEVRAYVDATRPGFWNSTWSTEPSAVVAPGTLTAAGAVAVAGQPRVGSTLRATLPRFTPAAGVPASAVKRSVAWLRDGRVVPGATGATYRLTAADVGHRVVARVTATAAGHARATASSRPTAAVVRRAVAVQVTATPSGARAARIVVTARAAGGTPTGSVVVRVGRTVVGRATLHSGRAVLRVSGLRAGRTVFAASYAGDAGTLPGSGRGTATVRS